MSFNGIAIFEQNLRKLQASDAFKNADFGRQMDLGYRLLNSKFGLNLFSAPKPLPTNVSEKKEG